MSAKCRQCVRLIGIIVNLLLIYATAQDQTGESVKNFGEQIGLALLDGLLQKSQEEVARQSLKKQIQLLEEINPSYAQILKQIPPEQLISTALAQRQNYAPDTGNPFLNILAKNGIIVGSNVVDKSANLNQQQQQQVGNIFQTILRNILQATQPSVVQNSLFGSQLPTQENTNPLAPNANQLVIPRGGPSLIQGAGSLIPGAEAFLGSLGGSAIAKPIVPAPGVDAPPNPFAPDKGLPDLGSITFPPQFLTTGVTTLADEEEETQETTVSEPENSSEVTESESSREADSREKKLEEINSRALKVLALRKLRLGDSGSAKPITRQIQTSTLVKSKTVRPVKIPEIGESSEFATQKFPKLETSDESVVPVVSGINSKNFAFLNRNTKTHSQFLGRTKFGSSKENGQALQLPVDGLPKAGLGRKDEDDTVLNAKLNIPKNWLSGQQLSAQGGLSRRVNNQIFGGAEQPQNFLDTRH